MCTYRYLFVLNRVVNWRDLLLCGDQAIKTRDSEIKLLRQRLSRAKEQAENEAMRREQEAYIAKQALKHV